MDKNTIKILEDNLKNQKKDLENELSKFAEKDKNLEGDWDTKFPKTSSDAGNAALEAGADEVEEYSTLLAMEHKLELRLKDIDDALAKIDKDSYGLCERCNKPIPEDRLKAYPAARYHIKC